MLVRPHAVLWLLLRCTAELRSWDRDRVTHKACSIYYLSLYRTGVPALLEDELRATLGRSLPPMGSTSSSVE